MNESPEQLLDYFQQLSDEQPNVDEWRSGAEAIQAWIALIDSEVVSAEDFEGLLRVVESPARAPGSGWFDLWIRV